MPLKKYLSHLKYFDWLLFFAVVVLLCFGLAALYSIAKSFDEPNFLNLKKQIIFAVTGLILAVIISFFNYNLLKSYGRPVLMVSLILLLAVLFLGATFHGTTGWLNIFGLTVQPVELAKLGLIIILAKFFSDNFRVISDLKFILISGLVTAIFFILTVLQPDFGSALLLFLIWFLLLLIAGVRRLHLISLVALLVIIFAGAWFFLFADYQKDRILTFINPAADPYGRGYHIRQATIAIGAGGITGRGLGFGSQSQLKFLPASQTDFIFAVIAEELGLVGAVLVLSFFTLFFWRLIIIAKRAPDNFGLFLILSGSVWLFSQFFINVGMNVGLLPVTGIGLPFLSYGGSFLLVSLLLVGIAESVASRSVKYKV